MLSNMISDVWNLNVALAGILVSIFTLLYSFISSKREYLKELSDEIKTGENDPILISRERAAIASIKKLAKAATISCYLLIGTVFTIILCSVAKNFNECSASKYLNTAAIILTSILWGILIYLGYHIFQQYKKDINV